VTPNFVLCDFLEATYHIILTNEKRFSCYWVWQKCVLCNYGFM